MPASSFACLKSASSARLSPSSRTSEIAPGRVVTIARPSKTAYVIGKPWTATCFAWTPSTSVDRLCAPASGGIRPASLLSAVEVDPQQLAELVVRPGRLAQGLVDLAVAVPRDERQRALGRGVEQLRLVRLLGREVVFHVARHAAVELEPARLGAQRQRDRLQ